jgi:hypothetical protein
MTGRLRRPTILLLAGSTVWAGLYAWIGPAAQPDVAEAVVRSVASTAQAAPNTAPLGETTPTPADVAATRATPTDRPADTTAAAPPRPLAEQRQRSIPSAQGNAFAVLHWLPPAPVAAPAPSSPPVIAPPPPAPAPSAPPLPFVFVGMLEKGTARPQAFLAKGEALLIVGAGDVLDNKTYRIESLSPQEVVMTYLPLNLRQTLRAAGGSP